MERQSASGHAIYVNEAGRTVVVPMHPGDIPAPTMKSIIEQTGMTVDEFIAYL
ncbi:type II toxin-antitoxin system HicA family toxin [Aggregatilinea sp.]|uniref:type II toxin-antitoxin system HicA family toxin n=1 Tax=Aggregatilinea sp. TaxID=2806333 RepID=UPI003FA55D4F